MAYLALNRIHSALGNEETAMDWQTSLNSSGGEAAVAQAWIDAVEDAILRVVPDAKERWPKHEEA